MPRSACTRVLTPRGTAAIVVGARLGVRVRLRKGARETRPRVLIVSWLG